MRTLMKLGLLVVGAVAGVAAVQAQSYVSRRNTSWQAEEKQERRASLVRCFELSASLFDDRVSPADVVADAVAWHCEAEGSPENYWAILSMRRTSPDAMGAYYRELALPFVLSQRVKRLQ